MQKFLLIAAVCSFALGVGVRSVYVVTLPELVWLGVLSFGLGVVWRRKSEALSAPTLLMLSVCLMAAALGIIRTEVASWQFGHSALATSVGDVVELNGVIKKEPDYRERTVQLFVETDTDTLLVSTDRMTDLQYGDRVQVKGKIEVPGTFETDLGRTFDYAGYLRARGVEYRISFADVSVIEYGEGSQILSSLLRIKHTFLRSIEQIIPEPAVGLGSGLLLGVQAALGDDIEEDFRLTGIIHIVVLSGYNVMLVVAFILFCFSFIMPMRWRLFFGVIAIIAFALIVGLSATVVRASIMAGLVLLAQALGRQYDVVRGLLLAGVVMLLINPYLLVYDIGFQLSFMATLGLLIIVPQFESKVVEGKGWFGIKEFFLATCATQVAVLPLLLYHIGQVSIIAVVVNVLVLPVVPVAMLLTFLTGVAGLLSPAIAAVLGFITTITLNYILNIAKWFADIPFAAVEVPVFNFLATACLYGVMIAVYIYVVKRKDNSSVTRGWKVVEEKDGVGSPSEPTPSKDLPIFFR